MDHRREKKRLKAKGHDSTKLPPFVPLTWDLLNGAAYKHLPPSPSKALPYFLGKIKKHVKDPDRCSVEFTFSYPEGKKLGFAPGTFSKIIRDLISHEFIDPVDKGGLRGKGKSCSIFKLSERWEAYGTADFHPINWDCFFPRMDKGKSKM